MVHVIGVPAAGVAVAALLAASASCTSGEGFATLALYGAALIALVNVSAVYHFALPGPAKQRLRRADHVMIFIAIAASYTPFALNVLPTREGIGFCIAVWTVAAIGVALKLLAGARIERISVLVYLGMGWMVLGMGRSFLTQLPGPVLILLFAEGVVFTTGALIYSAKSFAYRTPIWHVLVLIGAGFHLAALRTQFACRN